MIFLLSLFGLAAMIGGGLFGYKKYKARKNHSARERLIEGEQEQQSWKCSAWLSIVLIDNFKSTTYQDYYLNYSNLIPSRIYRIFISII